MEEYKLITFAIINDDDGNVLNRKLKPYIGDGWSVHSWQYTTSSRYEVSFRLVRYPPPVPEPVEPPKRKYIGMKDSDAI